MISTSCESFSDEVFLASSVGGGAPMAAAFLLFLLAKKLPKRSFTLCSIETQAAAMAQGGNALAGRGFPVFGSTCTGFAASCCSSR